MLESGAAPKMTNILLNGRGMSSRLGTVRLLEVTIKLIRNVDRTIWSLWTKRAEIRSYA